MDKRKTRFAIVMFSSTLLAACGGGGGSGSGGGGSADSIAPVLSEVTAVPADTNDTTPDYSFSSDEAGKIIYGGSCSSVTTTASAGVNTITFNSLGEGVYTDCTLQVKDAGKNVSLPLTIPAFTVHIAPVLAQVKAVPNTNDTTPDFSFSSDEAGTITYGGDCSSATGNAVAGNNTITFNTLPIAVHSNCTITVTDVMGNTSELLAVNTFRIVKPRPLNDTGSVYCGDFINSAMTTGTLNNDLDCNAVGATQTVNGVDSDGHLVPAGQDAVFGRDADPATNTSIDGYKGFSFTKLGADGIPLAIQNANWNDSGNEVDGTFWSCVKDNVTGLIWEIKTNKTPADLHDRDFTYTWYNSTGVNDGGDYGVGDTGIGTTIGYEISDGTIYSGSDNCFNKSRCDTEKYVADVNAAGLCGANDWRLPTYAELSGLYVYDVRSVYIDTDFIPNTIANVYFTSTATAYGVWSVNFGSAYFMGGKNFPRYVRLVRDLD